MYIKITLLAGSLLAIISCAGNNKNAGNDTDTTLSVQPINSSQLEVKPLSGYFLKNTIKVTDSLTFWIIDNQASFDSLFGVAKTMNNSIDQPDFGTQVVVAATMPATYYDTQIQLESATSDDMTNNAEMHFVATSSPDKNSAAIVPLWLGAIPKTGKSTFKLFTGDNLTKTITTQQ
ncbi:hypothetical protein HGH93_17910 [Chitinophaga polysaccharea]|uniref:hypothetical protein n=1 Tax=Chitinophaga TaxID=79328 RepID=UPI0014550EC8|nr:MULTISPECIES: hypothetical protein [Chitinophaga]NLR59991.1 hypothetical protein [Chitinophaga polysaccharea]NLU94220.1 hypothetical protein [Chitinophaga sp. Ak27]